MTSTIHKCTITGYPHDPEEIELVVDWGATVEEKGGAVRIHCVADGGTMTVKSMIPTGAYTGDGYFTPREPVMEEKSETFDLKGWDIGFEIAGDVILPEKAEIDFKNKAIILI